MDLRTRIRAMANSGLDRLAIAAVLDVEMSVVQGVLEHAGYELPTFAVLLEWSDEREFEAPGTEQWGELPEGYGTTWEPPAGGLYAITVGYEYLLDDAEDFALVSVAIDGVALQQLADLTVPYQRTVGWNFSSAAYATLLSASSVVSMLHKNNNSNPMAYRNLSLRVVSL